MVNADIRKKIFEAELTHKAVAAAVGVTPEHLSRLLSEELSEANRARILDAIRQIEQSKTA